MTCSRGMLASKISFSPAMVALIRESNSSSPLVTKLQVAWSDPLSLRSLDALPASSSTSAWGTQNAALYTAAVAPTLPWLVVRVFKCLWMRPTGNCSPALCERDTALACPQVSDWKEGTAENCLESCRNQHALPPVSCTVAWDRRNNGVMWNF